MGPQWCSQWASWKPLVCGDLRACKVLEALNTVVKLLANLLRRKGSPQEKNVLAIHSLSRFVQLSQNFEFHHTHTCDFSPPCYHDCISSPFQGPAYYPSLVPYRCRWTINPLIFYIILYFSICGFLFAACFMLVYFLAWANGEQSLLHKGQFRKNKNVYGPYFK